MIKKCFRLLLPGGLVLASAFVCRAQSGGSIVGTVTLESDGAALHGARVILSPIGRVTDSEDDGSFEFQDVPPGTYAVLAQSPGLASDSMLVQVAAGGTQTVDLVMRLAAQRESVTVTASGREELVVNALQPVETMDLTQLTLHSSASLGEVLQEQAGVTKRSSGPGNSRPVVRGFDGDRVLIMQDGVRTGSLSSGSGDHGEPVDVSQLERLEVVRGPATLLYGSNAIGGVVNAVSRHETHQHADPGVRGFLNATAGSNNSLGGGSGGFEFGAGNWEFWASGGGQRTGNYNTSQREILNSQTRLAQTNGGFGYYRDRAFTTFNYSFTDSLYGVPFDPTKEDPEIPELSLERHNFRWTGGLKNVGFLESITARLNYSDYNHQELVGGVPETNFFNNQTVYRVVFDQQKHGLNSGSFGFWGLHRDYKTVGEEALTPPTIQNAFAVFGLENLDFESRTRLQFGARVERNSYTPIGLRPRSFSGLSAAVGVSQELWRDGALAVNYSHSFRAPSLEELYNFGPHPGNQTYEIGNPNLQRESNDGLDVSLRHQSARIHGELNLFYYHINDFVSLAPTGSIEAGLPVAEYLQQNARYAGSEAKLDVAVHPNLWINLGSDMVNAKLTSSNTFLPRIPPLRGHLGFEAFYKEFRFKPEVVLAYAQNKTFPTETRTAGYAVVNLSGSYTVARAHQLHIFSVEMFNASDTLYRNHLSFIKAYAPEIGRGVRVSYNVQFF